MDAKHVAHIVGHKIYETVSHNPQAAVATVVAAAPYITAAATGALIGFGIGGAICGIAKYFGGKGGGNAPAAATVLVC